MSKVFQVLRDALFNILTAGYWSKGYYTKQFKELSRKVDEIKPVEKYTLLTPYDPTSEVYLRSLTEIANHPAFEFFLFRLDHSVLDMIKTAPMDKAQELMGVSKGLEVLRSSLSDIIAEYNATRMGGDA